VALRAADPPQALSSSALLQAVKPVLRRRSSSLHRFCLEQLVQPQAILRHPIRQNPLVVYPEVSPLFLLEMPFPIFSLHISGTFISARFLLYFGGTLPTVERGWFPIRICYRSGVTQGCLRCLQQRSDIGQSFDEKRNHCLRRSVSLGIFRGEVHGELGSKACRKRWGREPATRYMSARSQ